jgi:hypothetical protein
MSTSDLLRVGGKIRLDLDSDNLANEEPFNSGLDSQRRKTLRGI